MHILSFGTHCQITGGEFKRNDKVYSSISA